MCQRLTSVLSVFRSQIGKKIITGITGLGLVIFVIAHMLGNLSYLSGNADAYNAYAEKLASFGPLLYLAEVGLLLLIVVHAVIGVNIYVRKRRARPQGYAKYRSAGKPSRMTLSSRTMIITGLVLLLFLVFHLNSFKFGPGMAEGYVANVDGAEVRDLKRLMTEKFQHPLYAFGYTGAMLLLGFHLRHGVWSAFQSLGWMNAKATSFVYAVGVGLAALLVIGFSIVPLYIYFSNL